MVDGENGEWIGSLLSVGAATQKFGV